MVDFTQPLEFEDGTPVTRLGGDPNNRWVRTHETPQGWEGSGCQDPTRGVVFINNDGFVCGFEDALPKVRNR